MSVKIEPVTPKVDIGESPFWDVDSQTLYFVDVIGKSINKYCPATNLFSKSHISFAKDTVSCVVPIDGRKNEFLIASGEEVLRIVWDDASDTVEKLETYAENMKRDGKRYKFNDGRVDFSGRLWIGYFAYDPSAEVLVVPEKAGGLVSIKSKSSVKEHLDSLADEVYRFDYDANTNEISHKEVIFKFSSNGIGGIPDGMAIDENDNLWIASFGGGKIVNIDPRKSNTIIRTIDMPVADITSVAFGGPNLDELYVTTPGVQPMEGYRPLEGGYLYRITGLGIRGFPGRKVKLA